MKDYNHIFHTLNEHDSPENTRMKFASTLKKLAIDLDRNPENTASIAYGIAGLLATDYAQTLDATDPIDEILTIAGELEVSPSNVNELRTELLQKINAL